MVRKFSKYAGKQIQMIVKDSQAECGYKVLDGAISSFKDKDYQIFELTFLTTENKFHKDIKVEDIILINTEVSKK